MPEKKKWARPPISYSVSPSFEYPFNVSLSWSRARKQYLIKYTKGFSFDVQEQWLAPNPDTEKIMDLARKINLPKDVPEIIGLDGTFYHLKIGKGAAVKSFRWWVYLPCEWSSIKPIIRIIKRLVEKLRGEARMRDKSRRKSIISPPPSP